MKIGRFLFWLLVCGVLPAESADPAAFKSIPLHSRITGVSPMTGIVFWDDSEKVDTDAIQLEYFYIPYNKVVNQVKGQYDWSFLDKKLQAIASRGHQAICRFYDTYPAQPNGFPDYIRKLADYEEMTAKSEGKNTGFPDWRHPELKSFVLEFFTKLAQRYDDDPRIVFLQVGFGLWAEYHIYDGPQIIGRTFPDKAFQAQFYQHLDRQFKILRWNISVDAADSEYSPIEGQPDLLAISFGLFDDSFMCKEHPKVNAKNWAFFGENRWQRCPAGGEFSYYKPFDQRNVLNPAGLYGKTFEQSAAAFHITYMIGNDQPQYHSMERIRQASQACGYKLKVISFVASDTLCRAQVKNIGVAPLYYDAFVAVNGIRCKESLAGLLPGQTRLYQVDAGGPLPSLTIESDRLVAGQKIEYEAD
jgi:hypothetical protein